MGAGASTQRERELCRVKARDVLGEAPEAREVKEELAAELDLKPL